MYPSENLGAIKKAAQSVLSSSPLYVLHKFDEDLEVYQYHDAIQQFQSDCRDLDFFPEFDWLEEGNSAEVLLKSPEKITQLKLEPLRKILTIHFKNEQFRDGHLAQMIDLGHLQALLNHLIQIS